MDGWIDGWIIGDRWMSGELDEKMIGWMDGWMDLK